MPQSIIGAWRAFSLLKQADIATAQPVNTRLNFEGEPMEPEPEKFYLNDDEVTGELLPTKTRLLTKKFSGKHKSKAFPHIVGLFASMAMGKDTPTLVGTTTAYKHKIEIDKTVGELPTRTMVENDGFNQKVYRGVACTGFTLSGQRGDFVEFEADLIGAGAEADDVTVKPDGVDESYLVYGDANLFRGGTFDGTAVTGGTSLSAPLRNFKFSFKNSGKGVYLFGDGSGNVGSIRRGSKFEAELEADLELEDSSHRDALLAGTEYVMNIPIIGGTANGTAKYTIEVILPRVVYREAKKGVDDGTLKVASKFAVLAHPTYGGPIIHVINLQQASYLAAA
jgi:hypothetical protein